MADLDDFFAKKDKKTKNKKKGISNIDLEEKFERETAERVEKEKRIKVDFSKLEEFIQDDGEWNDFVDEDNRDYSGLKITSLSIRGKEEEQRDEEEAALRAQNETDVPWKKENKEGVEEEPSLKKPEPAVVAEQEPENKETTPTADAPLKPINLRIWSHDGEDSTPNFDSAKDFPGLSDSIGMEAPKEEPKKNPWRNVGGRGDYPPSSQREEEPTREEMPSNRYSFLRTKPVEP